MSQMRPKNRSDFSRRKRDEHQARNARLLLLGWTRARFYIRSEHRRGKNRRPRLAWVKVGLNTQLPRATPGLFYSTVNGQDALVAAYPSAAWRYELEQMGAS
jgi:hypothetical protein